MILFVIGMVAILGIAGLALDSGHAMLNKSRLQNIVDASALSAAKMLDDSGDLVLSEAEARAMFALNAAAAGNQEIDDALNNGTLDVEVEFSNTLNPFVPGSSPAAYVRVRAENFTMRTWFAGVLGIDETGARASAVAGPSPTIDRACNVLPVMVCGDPDAGPPYWGYTPGEPDVLKSGSSNGGDFEVGPGNFQLIRLGDGQGADVVREAMAGSFNSCLSLGDAISTEPGNSIGPVAQGLNTRFGQYRGPMRGMESVYPPDVVTEQPIPPLSYDSDTDQILQGGVQVTQSADIDFAYPQYEARVEAANYNYAVAPVGIGAFRRREAAVAIGDCSTATNGQGTLPLLGFGCYFMLQEVGEGGQNAELFGEFIEDCRTGGLPGPAPTTLPGPHVIQLYRDYGSIDS